MISYFTLNLKDDYTLEFLSQSSLNSKFDDFIVLFKSQNKNIQIFEDILQEVVNPFYMILTQCLEDKNQLNSELKVGKVGKAWNIWTNNLPEVVEESEIDIFEQYWVWSCRDFQTWVYVKDGKTYIEISPSYRFHFVEPINDEPFITFTQFINEFQSIVIELTKEQVKEILNKLQTLKVKLNI